MAGSTSNLALTNFDQPKLVTPDKADGSDHLWKQNFAKKPNGMNFPTMHIMICALLTATLEMADAQKLLGNENVVVTMDHLRK